MKKFLFIAAMLFATTAHADWTFLVDATDNETRIMVDPLTFSSSMNASHYHIVSMQFLIIRNGNQVPFYVVTGANDCSKGFGEMVVGASKEDFQKFVWANGGSKLYDIEAQYICSIYNALKAKGQI